MLVHLLVLFINVTVLTPKKPPLRATREPIPIEIDTLPQELLYPEQEEKKLKLKPKKEDQIAESEDAGNRDLDPNAAYLSDKTQTAKKQMRAKKVDDFRKKKGEGIGKEKLLEETPLPPTGKTAEGVPSSPLDLQDSDIGVADKKDMGIKRDWKSLSMDDLSISGNGAVAAASDDWLEEVEEGDQTILSTREFRYFSYYNRIKVLLRQHWKPNVQRKLQKLWRSGRTISSSEKVTKVLVLLDTEGDVKKVSRLGSSGVKELDNAAVEAFKMAAPFPNPPDGIIDSDGFVRIRWDFIVKTEGSAAIRWKRPHSRPRP